MCSVVGYVGKGKSKAFVLEGLARLEYRGYDSAGFACLQPGYDTILYRKAEGHLSNLIQKCTEFPIDGNIGIGHTRWATHGVSDEHNAHPQFDCKLQISIVHNGIIENYLDLRRELESTHRFISDTDTEVIAHLLERYIGESNSFIAGIVSVVTRLRGAYAFIAIFKNRPDAMLLVRKRSPLCIGIGRGEMFVASDPLAFAEKTSRVLFLPDEHIALVQGDGLELYTFAGVQIEPVIQDFVIDQPDCSKKGYDHFMLKEIYEQKDAITRTVTYLAGRTCKQLFGISAPEIGTIDRIVLVGCGTSWHAAGIAQFFFERYAKIPTYTYIASELRFMDYFPHERTMYLVISQSGETADVLEAVRMLKKAGHCVYAITNVVSSTLVREADGTVFTQAGHEIAVASTKAFSTQLAVLYYLAHAAAQEKGLIDPSALRQAERDLLVVAELQQHAVERYRKVIKKVLAPRYAAYGRSIFLGRHINYPFAMEAALKLKEISYIFAQSYPAGELKHGPLALVDHHMPIFIFSLQDHAIYAKLVANAQEVKARGGRIIAFLFEGQDELAALAETVFTFPPVPDLLAPLVMTSLMQYFAYEIALVLGCEIDRPRNLAKSVTVE